MPRVDARRQVPLLRRAEDHQPPAQVGTEPGELLEVLGGAAAHGGIGAGDVKPLGLGQEPVQADDLQPGGSGGLADLGPLAAADLA